MSSCQKSIEKVANYQVEFWAQVAKQLPDLNILYDIEQKIFLASQETEDYWKKLCRINPNHHKALVFYGNYILEIKNNNKVAHEYLEK